MFALPAPQLLGHALVDGPGGVLGENDSAAATQTRNGYCNYLALGDGEGETLTRGGGGGQLQRGTPEGSSDSESYMPPVPPHRTKKKGPLTDRRRSSSLDRLDELQMQAAGDKRATISFGLPPTPKVTQRNNPDYALLMRTGSFLKIP